MMVNRLSHLRATAMGRSIDRNEGNGFRRLRLLWGGVAAVLLLLLLPGDSSAAPPATDAVPSGTKQAAVDNEAKKGPLVDRATEQQVVSLVHSHLPDLRPVLDRLREHHPRQYQRAVRDLARTSRKLQVAEHRDRELYNLELELWKAHNRVNLLVARLKVRDSQADRTALLAAVEQQQSAKRKRIQYDVDSLRSRIDRAQQQLKAAEERLAELDQPAEADPSVAYEKLLHQVGRKPDS